MQKSDERKYKVERILEEYDKRNSQEDIARKFGIRAEHVSWVTQMNGYKHTRKITPENRRENEKITPVIFYDDFDFLDVYPIENFK